MGLLTGHLAPQPPAPPLLAAGIAAGGRLRHRGVATTPRILPAGAEMAVLLAGQGDMAGSPEGQAGLTVLCDARLTNAGLLVAELRAGGHQIPAGGPGGSDAGVILAGWQAWGPGLLPRLRGPFALVVLDGPRGLLFCARDRFGQRPLHYARAGEGFAFASEVQALLAWPGVGREADLDAVAHALAFGQVPLDGGPLLGMGRVKPGHLLMRDAAGRVSQTDWREDAIPEASDKAPAEALRGLLDASVGDAMGEYGVAGVLGDGLPATALEESLARVAAWDDGSGLPAATLPAADLPALLVRLLRHQGDPVVDAAALGLHAGAETAVARGGGLMLATAGAGELLLGHARHERFARDLMQMRTEGRPPAWWAGGFRDTVPFARDLFHAAGDNPGEAERFELSGPALLHTLVFSLPDRLGASLETAGAEDAIDRAARLDVAFRLPGRDLASLDTVAALTGATIACPMLDETLAAWSLTQTQAVRRRGPGGRDMAFGLLAAVAPAGGTARVPPMPAMPAGLRDFACETLLDRRCQERGLFGRERLQAALRRYRASENAGTVALWRMLCIELWFRHVVDADVVLPFAAPISGPISAPIAGLAAEPVTGQAEAPSPALGGWR